MLRDGLIDCDGVADCIGESEAEIVLDVVLEGECVVDGDADTV